MKELDLEAMPLDDLWTLHEAIGKLLSERIIAEKQHLEARLLQLNRGTSSRRSLGNGPDSDSFVRALRDFVLAVVILGLCIVALFKLGDLIQGIGLNQ